MALPQITFTAKEDRRSLDSILAKNKVSAADMNEIKTVVNALCAVVDQLRLTENNNIDVSDFSGSDYQNSDLVGKVPYRDFMVWDNKGSGDGALLRFGTDYSFTGTTGTITMTPGKYIVQIYKALT